MILVFKNREETIIKASNDRVGGVVVTDKRRYSTDFIHIWRKNKFLTIKNS
jgi:hypothetical protein